MSTTDGSASSLPIFDLAVAADDPDPFRADLLDATHRLGFFYLVGHGIEQRRFDDLIDIARRFFSLSDADKDEISQLRSPQFRGYSRLGGELTNGAVDWREQIDIGPERAAIEGAEGYWHLQGPNLWPSALPELRPALEQWSEDLAAVGRELLGHWAAALGAPVTVFDDAFADRPATLMKVVRYPGSESDRQGVGAHKDSGVLTLLLVEPDTAGLQVEGPDGEWIDVPPRRGAFIVNIGELLEVATGGYLRATRHRVLAPPPGRDRISIPYFLNPGLDAQIPVLELPGELARHSRGVELDPDNPIFNTYGENAWKSRTRAHPDVALRHHGIRPAGAPTSY
ncbi:isopenicillin N synthase family dioxygenase [Gordonia sp. NPDC003422]